MHPVERGLQRWLMAWVLLASTVEWVGSLFIWARVNNAPLYNCFILVEFMLLLHMASHWPQSRMARSLWFRGPILLGWAVEMFTIAGRPLFVTYSFLFGTLIILAFYLLVLWNVVNEFRGPLRRSYAFWLSVAVLVYFGSAAPLMGSINYFIGVDLPLAQRLYWVVRVLCIIKFALMGIACLNARNATSAP